MIRWFHVEPQGVDPCTYVPGLYTQAQVDDLINIDAYIPVASIEELDKIDLGGSQTMGGCTIWAGTYTTGLDKSYIQVKPIDGSLFGNFDGVGTIASRFEGIYDGNELLLSNITLNGAFDGAMFVGTALGAIQIKNCILNDIIKTSTVVGGHSLFIYAAGPGSIINNCHMTNGTLTLTSVSVKANVGGICGAIINSTMTNCSFQGIISNTGPTSGTSTAGVLGYAENNCTITNLRTFNSTITGVSEVGGVIGDSANVTAGNTISDIICETTTVNGTSSVVGGAVGYFRSGTISRVRSSATVNKTGGTFGCGGAIGVLFGATPIATEIECTGTVNNTAGGAHTGTGGVVGIVRSATLSNSYATGNVSGATQVGGLVGQLRQGTITNCYSTGVPSGTSGVGGMVGAVVSSGTSNASYWDTDTSGTVTSIRGTGQTTVALQTPTSNTGIYSAYTIPPWSFPGVPNYPFLTTTP